MEVARYAISDDSVQLSLTRLMILGEIANYISLNTISVQDRKLTLTQTTPQFPYFKKCVLLKSFE